MLDRLTSMRVFVSAAKLGSFAAAAAKLEMSAQMVARHVAILESRLGIRLLRRTTRKQSLTEFGRLYYDRCRHILAEVDAAEALAHETGAMPKGTLKVNAPVSAKGTPPPHQHAGAGNSDDHPAAMPQRFRG